MIKENKERKLTKKMEYSKKNTVKNFRMDWGVFKEKEEENIRRTIHQTSDIPYKIKLVQHPIPTRVRSNILVEMRLRSSI